MRDSFVLYRSFIQAIEDQSPENFKAIIKTVSSYALDGITPESMDGSLKMAFNFMKPLIDSNNAKWEATRKKRAESGKKGGLAKQANARIAKQNIANLAVDVNVDEYVDVDVDVDDQSDDSTDDQTTTINSQHIQEVAKTQGFIITPRQARDFIKNITDNSWLTGEHNFIDFVAEKIKANGYSHDEQIKMFVKSYKRDFYITSYPAWKIEQESKANNKANQSAIESARDNPPQTCKCGGELKNNGSCLFCYECRNTFYFRNGEWVEEDSA